MNIWESYDGLVNFVKTNGILSAPRGQATREILNGVVTFPAGRFINRYNLNRKLAILESLMLLGGIFDKELIAKVAPHAQLKLYEYQSDYGPRIVDQLPKVVSLLKEDPESRRAVLYFNDRCTPDYDRACTTSIQFMIRKGQLLSTVTMRSWDLVYGLPMDIVMFGMLAKFVAKLLDIQAGHIVCNAASIHLYEATGHLAHETLPPSMFELGEAWNVPKSLEDMSAVATAAAYSLPKWKGLPDQIMYFRPSL